MLLRLQLQLKLKTLSHAQRLHSDDINSPKRSPESEDVANGGLQTLSGSAQTPEPPGGNREVIIDTAWHLSLQGITRNEMEQTSGKTEMSCGVIPQVDALCLLKQL